MNTLEAETEINETVQATEAVEIIDCGRVSERTHGTLLSLLFEVSSPPNNKLFLW